jgi:hypothetical protein
MGLRLDPCCDTVLAHLPRIFEDVPFGNPSQCDNAAGAAKPPRTDRAAIHGLNASTEVSDDLSASAALSALLATQRPVSAFVGEPSAIIAGGRTARRSGRVEARFTGLASSDGDGDAPLRPHGWGTLEAVIYDSLGRAIATHVVRCGEWQNGLANGPGSERSTKLDPVTGEVASVDFREGQYKGGLKVAGFEKGASIVNRSAPAGVTTERTTSSLYANSLLPPSPPPRPDSQLNGTILPRGPAGELTAESVISGDDWFHRQHGHSFNLGPPVQKPRGPLASAGQQLLYRHVAAARATPDLVKLLAQRQHTREHVDPNAPVSEVTPTPTPPRAGPLRLNRFAGSPYATPLVPKTARNTGRPQSQASRRAAPPATARKASAAPATAAADPLTARPTVVSPATPQRALSVAAQRALQGLTRVNRSSETTSDRFKARAAAWAGDAAEEACVEAVARHHRIIGQQWQAAVENAGAGKGKPAPFRAGQSVTGYTSRSDVTGVVRYCGPRQDGRAGLVVGIETSAPHPGFHDGEVHGRRYFVCEPGHGILLPSDRVASAFSARPFAVGSET